jgi:pimeloyl-ACP methyl ester carboxylesterase
MAPANGTQLYFECTGTGPPLVLIPNRSADRRVWHDQVAAFARHYQVVRYDLRGWGRSPRRMGIYRHAQDLAGLLDWLGSGRATLVGYKWGADIALDFALDWPEQVAALVLIEPLLSGWRPRAQTAEFDALVARLMEAAAEPNPAKRAVRFVATGRAMSREFDLSSKPRRTLRSTWAQLREDAIGLANLPRTLAMVFGGPSADQRHLQVGDQQDRDVQAASYNALDREPPAFACLEQVSAPTVIVRGVPTLSMAMELDDDLRTRIAGAELTLLANAPVVPQMIQPGALNRVVLDFLQRMYPPR